LFGLSSFAEEEFLHQRHHNRAQHLPVKIVLALEQDEVVLAIVLVETATLAVIDKVVLDTDAR
jgi:hypothetical protein